jgi:phage FluMu gp28-like protein
VEVSLSRQWYEMEMPPYIEAFGDKTIVLPEHADILSDHQALQYVDGLIRVPKDFRFKGSDGFNRHGDSAVACALAYFASRQDYAEYAYRGVSQSAQAGGFDTAPEDEPERGWWKQPLGARLRGFL